MSHKYENDPPFRPSHRTKDQLLRPKSTRHQSKSESDLDKLNLETTIDNPSDIPQGQIESSEDISVEQQQNNSLFNSLSNILQVNPPPNPPNPNQSHIFNSSIYEEDSDDEMSIDKLPQIEKLDRHNYDDWSIRLRMSLNLRNLWLDPSTEVNNLSETERKTNQQAGNFLVLTLSKENLQVLDEGDYSNFITAWNKLKGIHKPRTQSCLAEIYGNITHARHISGNPINNHLIYLQTQFSLLADLGEPLNEKQKVAFIQGTLREDPDFSELIRSGNWLDQNDLTTRRVCEVLNAACKYKTQECNSANVSTSRSNIRRSNGRPQRKFRRESPRDSYKCPPCKMNNHTFQDCGIYNPNNNANNKQRFIKRNHSANNTEVDLPIASNSIIDRLGPQSSSESRFKTNSNQQQLSETGIIRNINYIAATHSYSIPVNSQTQMIERSNTNKTDELSATQSLLNSRASEILQNKTLLNHVTAPIVKPFENNKIIEFKTYNACILSDRNKWIVDSGATDHMIKDTKYFSHISEFKGFCTVANGHQIPITGKGIVNITINNGGISHSVTLKDALLVPDLDSNLISVQSLTENGFILTFTHNQCVANCKNQQFVLGTRTNNQYYANVQHNLFSSNLCVHDWHKRMAHKNIATVKNMNTRGIEIQPCSCSNDCLGCLGGKSITKSFPKRSEKPANPLDLIVSDICGPLHTQSINGCSYFLTLIDAHSDYTEVHALKHKNEAKDIVINYIERCYNLFSIRIKTFRSDRGGEYLDSILQNYLRKHGIKFECTVHDSPQQNGISERKNRTLMEAVRSMLIHRNLPNYLWNEALKNAVYTFNRIPRKHRQSCPAEIFFNDSIKSEFHEFGSPVYFTTKSHNRRKLDPRGLPALFLSVDDTSKGYRLYVNGKIRIERNVTFLSQQLNNDKVTNSIPETICDTNIPTYTQASNDTPLLRRSERLRLKQSLTINYDDPHFEPSTYKQAISCPDKDKWLHAMQEEISSIEENKTWSLTNLPKDRRAIGCRWVFKLKLNELGEIERYKARLVAQGFTQKYGVDYDEVFAPVARPATFRTLLAIAGHNNMIIKQYDVKTAFLNGDLHEEIYMKLPPGSDKSQKVLRLHKSLYGLKQAARMWNIALHDHLLKIGFKQSLHDHCLYSITNGKNVCYMIIHVDDALLVSNTDKYIEYLAAEINKRFEFKCLGKIKQFLGIIVNQNANNIYEISQTPYITKIAKEFQLNDAKGSKYPLDPGYFKLEDTNFLDSNTIFRKLIGMLLYISTNTRPDISVAVNILAQRVTKPRELDITEVKRIVKYLLATKNHVLRLGEPNSTIPLIAFSDANWGESRIDRKSISGVICKVFGGTVSWSSRKQSMVSLSTTESEYYALAETVKETLWLIELLKDLKVEICSSPIINVDSQPCIKMISNEKFSQRTKHIDVRFHFVKNALDENRIKLSYCPTDVNIADMMTKPLAGIKIKSLRELANVIDITTS